ncbi:hypothetical protein [Vibrio parahaemolyticus]|uniref:hypothetical protein n=1 Tax=Vibrio parahaemolyticus TaxID=670 RepID=UPI00047026A3|nr:hypothetical protein [Vibrio parahaemolyticus]MDG2844641.1 hypothetical protein [Vibrio parahaemolyticus]MDG2865513.1 hypothetical protein [Vibrio parahaemolyticus]RXQ00883.1 hypothetical protein EGL69_22125 [Vibrio parahaemolyticus]
MKMKTVTALQHYAEYKSKFKELISNCELKLSEMKGLTVLPSDLDSVYISFEALDKQIDLCFKLVMHNDRPLGELNAYLVEDSKHSEHLKSFWFDRTGNIREVIGDSFCEYATSEPEALYAILAKVLNALIDSNSLKPQVIG